MAAQRTSLGFSGTGLLVLCECGLSVVKQEDAVMAMRLNPTFRQWTSEVTGTSEKRAWSRDNLAKPPSLLPSLLSMSLTTLRISCRSAWRVIPRMFKMADTCFFLKARGQQRWSHLKMRTFKSRNSWIHLLGGRTQEKTYPGNLENMENPQWKTPNKQPKPQPSIHHAEICFSEMLDIHDN